ncbi:MAG: murein biosynthesis integral membrane protein MurJ [Atopobiaceae bacterium]|nr:murein biosynthesis integral membrane protein MurJ [Atopobiaceae bacterium]
MDKYVPKHFKPDTLALWTGEDAADDEADDVVPQKARVGSLDTVSSRARTVIQEPLEVLRTDAQVSPERKDDAVDGPSDAGSEAAVGRSAAMMSVLVIISRITGFARTWAQALALGVTVISSCYTVANNLPNMLYELVMGGMLATAFLPVYLSVKQRAGREGANRYTSNLLSIVMLFMGILTVVGIVFAGQVVWTQSFGATSDFDFDLATYFFRFFAIEVILYALSSVISGVLNAERDYLWSNAAPIFNNIVCTSSFFLYIAFAESNPSLAILCLALGNPLGVAIQVLMQLPSLRKHGISLKPRIDFRDPALRETLSIGIPSLVVTICSFITVSVQNSSALSVTVSGSSIAYYTRIWYTLPYSIFAIPITTAMFTELSNYVSKGDLVATARGVASGTSKILFMLIPFTLYLMVFSEPLIMLMAGGRFTADQVTLTAQYLVVLAASLPMYGVCTYQQKVCSSLRRMKLYMVSIALGSVVQVAFCLVLTPMYGLMMVPLSSVFFFTLVDVVTFVSLRRQLGNMGLKSVLFSALKATVLGALGAGVGYGLLMALQSNFGPLGSSILQALAYTVAAGIPAVLVTFGIAVALRMPEAATFSSILGRFFAKRAATE